MRHQSTVLAGVAALSAPDLAAAAARQRPSRNVDGGAHPKQGRRFRPTDSPTFSPSTWFPTFFPTMSPVTAEQEAAMEVQATPPPTRKPTKRNQPTPRPTKRPTRFPTWEPTTKPTAAPTVKTSEPTAKPTAKPTPDTPQLGRPSSEGGDIDLNLVPTGDLVQAQTVSVVDDGPYTLLLGTDFASVPVLDNDSGDSLSVRAIVAPAANGSCDIDLSLAAVIYSPDAGYVGSDSCTYEACDAAGTCGTATLSVAVKAEASAAPTENNSRPEEEESTPLPTLPPVAAPVTPAGTEQTLSPTVVNTRSTPFPTESTPEPTVTTPLPTPVEGPEITSAPVGYDDYTGEGRKKEYGYGGNEHVEGWYPGYGREHGRHGKSGKTKGGKSGYQTGKSGARGKSGKTKGVSGSKAAGWWHADMGWGEPDKGYGGYADDAWSWIPGPSEKYDDYAKKPTWSAPPKQKPAQWAAPKPGHYGVSDSWLAYDGESKTAKAESTWEGAHQYLAEWYGDDYAYDGKTHKEPDWNGPPAWSAPQAWSAGPAAESKGGKEPDWSAPPHDLAAWYGDDYAYDSKTHKEPSGGAWSAVPAESKAGKEPDWSPPAAAWAGPAAHYGAAWAGGDDYTYAAKGAKRHRTRRQ